MSHYRFYHLLDKLDAILAVPQAYHVHRDRVAHLLENPILARYFFGCVKDLGWLEALKEKGVFNHPPRRKVDSEKATISCPSWPQSKGLARLAKDDPYSVAILSIASAIPKQASDAVHADLVEAACALDPALAARWAKGEEAWVRAQDRLYTRLPEKLGELVSHLSKGGETDVALALAEALLSLSVTQDGQGASDRTSGMPRYVNAKFDDWHYERVLQQNVPDLVQAAGLDALTRLCRLLDQAITLSLQEPEQVKPEDYSYIGRPAVEDHEQNRTQDIRGMLVTAVRDAAELVVRDRGAGVDKVVSVLEGMEWKIFRRIALHVLRVFPEDAGGLIFERLSDVHLLHDDSQWHEYALLLSKCFPCLGPDERQAILSNIETGDRAEWYPSMVKQHGTEAADRWLRASQLRCLCLIHEHLPPEWQERYQALDEELKAPNRPDLLRYTESAWVAPTSPKTSDELREMGPPQIAAFLREWKPRGEPTSPSLRGLARVLEEVVAEKPAGFAAEATCFKDIPCTYVNGLISGFRNALRQELPFEWPKVLQLCAWAVSQPRETGDSEAHSMDRDPDWGWAWREMATLLGAGFDAQKAGIPFDLRDQSWDVVRKLSDDIDPTPEHETEFGGTNMDPATMSINTVRGEAMHSTVRYARWVQGHLAGKAGGLEGAGGWFEQMPEVQKVLDLHLDTAHDPALAVRSVYGQWFPWLVKLDRGWARAQANRVFAPEGQQDLGDAAWDTYLAYCQAYDSVYDLLQNQYARAVERIGETRPERSRPADPDEKLAEHLMTLYWRGKVELDATDGLMRRFFQKAPPPLRAHAIGYAGRCLNNEKADVPEEPLVRLKALWEARVSAASAADDSQPYAEELAEFGWWFASVKFGDEWSVDQLLSVSEIGGRIEAEDAVADKLVAIAPQMPLKAVRCLRGFAQSLRDDWSFWRSELHARGILCAAITSGSQEAREEAIDLVHRLGAMGYLQFRDLLDM